MEFTGPSIKKINLGDLKGEMFLLVHCKRELEKKKMVPTVSYRWSTLPSIPTK